MDCPNLKELFGDRCRVVVEESYYAETGKHRRVDAAPWYFVVLCRKGHICPWAPDLLAACTRTRGPVVKQLVQAGCVIVQDGDDGVNATFPLAAFDEVAEIMQPRKRRSPDASRHLKEHQYARVQCRENDEIVAISVVDDSPVIAG